MANSRLQDKAEHERNAAVDKSRRLQKRVSQLEEVVLALSEPPKAAAAAKARSKATAPVAKRAEPPQDEAYTVPRKSPPMPITPPAGTGFEPNTAARKAAFSRRRRLPVAPAVDVRRTSTSF